MSVAPFRISVKRYMTSTTSIQAAYLGNLDLVDLNLVEDSF